MELFLRVGDCISRLVVSYLSESREVSTILLGEMVISYSDRLLIAFMILSMVAERVYGVEPSTSSDNGNGNGGTAMSKAFATSTKLSETNFMIWYAGILTVLLGVTIDPYSKVMQVLERVQNELHKTLDQVYIVIGSSVFSKIASFRGSDEWKLLDKVLFNVIYWTVDETIPGLKSSLATTMMFKGLEALKFIHDNYGPGCNTAQVGRAIDIMNETQNEQETAQEYGTRLLSINASLHEKIPESLLKQIFMRGITSVECKAFLLKEVS